jgi:hypothetical protein
MMSLNVSPQRLIQALFFLCRAVSIGYSCALVKLFSAKGKPWQDDAARHNDV